MIWLEYGVLVVVLLIVVPIMIYLSAKLGVYGFLRGKTLYEEDEKKRSGEKRDTKKPAA